MTPSTAPPGPRLPAAVQTALLFRDVPGYLGRSRRRFGDVFRVDLLGAGKLAYVGNPRLAREVYDHDGVAGCAGDARRPYLEPLVGRQSVLCLEGDEWERQRRLLAPRFHARQVNAYRAQIEEIAAAEIERWPAGKPLQLRPRMQVITLEVILRVVFGVRDDARLAQLRQLLPRIVEVAASPLISGLPTVRRQLERNPVLRRTPGNPLRRFVALRSELDSYLHDEIGRRRSEIANGSQPDDVLSLLLAAEDEGGERLSDAELRDALVTLLVAGHETTATALAWCFERLARHSRVLDRLRSDLGGNDDDYLDAVVKETLRTRPVVIDTPRRLKHEIDVGGYTIPAGWMVAPAIPLVHSAPEVFADAEAFRPERFLEDKSLTRAWIPFGGGKRRCLGSALALLEMKTIVRAVLARWTPHATNAAPEHQQVQHVTLAPHDMTRVVLERAA